MSCSASSDPPTTPLFLPSTLSPDEEMEVDPWNDPWNDHHGAVQDISTTDSEYQRDEGQSQDSHGTQTIKCPYVNEDHPRVPQVQTKKVNLQQMSRHRCFIGNQDLGLRQKLKKQQMVIYQQKNNQAHSEALHRIELQKTLEMHEEAARGREHTMLEQLAALQADKDTELTVMAHKLERERLEREQERLEWERLHLGRSSKTPQPQPNTIQNHGPSRSSTRTEPKILAQIRQQKKVSRIKQRTVLVLSSDESDPAGLPTSPEHTDQEEAMDQELTMGERRLKKLMEDCALRAVQLDREQSGIHARARPRRKQLKSKRELQAEKQADTKDERSVFLSLIRDLIKDVFGVENDEDFALHDFPPLEIIRAYAKGHGEGPNEEDLQLDMRGKKPSKWNERVAQILLDKLLLTMSDGCADLPERSDAYFLDMITEKIDRARGYWRKAQPKIKDDGEVETLQEVEDRMIVSKDENGKYSRMGTRRRARYNRRLTTVQRMIQLKREEGATDVSAWQWMEQLLRHLGEDGMSSDESDIEGELDTTVFRVKTMPWRRNIDKELNIIDKQRVKDKDLFSPRGSKPGPRIRHYRNPPSDRRHVSNLPREFYDNDWFEDQDPNDRRFTVDPSKEKFKWMRIGAR